MSEIEKLRDRVMQLEDALGLTPTTELVFLGLTQMEEQMLGMLLKREIVAHEQYDLAIPKKSGAERDTLQVFQVHISRMRRKLKPLGVTIAKKHGIGHYMKAEDKRRLRQLIEAARQ